jgi:oligopeptide/dipeptide ABC transporter ATP-binding protein
MLEVDGLKVSFTTREGARQVVRGIDLAVAPGEVVGIVGESGSGKSTTALAIADLLPRTARVEAASLRVAGHDIMGADARSRRRILGRNIGFVFQDPSTSLDPTMTVGEQVAGPLRLHLGLSGAVLRDKVIETMTQAGLADAVTLAGRYPHQLSGGQRQRVMIAIAISCTPSLLIADEPTTALDVTIQAEILDLFARLRVELGVAVVFVSHDLAVIGELADRVCVLYAGRLVELGAARDVLDRPQHPYSAALVECAPWLGRGRGPLRVIDGSPPGPGHPDIGCAFRPRCEHATAECAAVRPELRPVATQLVACHHAGAPHATQVVSVPTRRLP